MAVGEKDMGDIAGPYAGFGAGLIAGKKTSVSPDPFTRGPVIYRGGPFAPCESGNPLHCFQGVAGGFTSQAIAARLDLSTRTVESYRAQIMEKMQAEAWGEL